ncbi:MAG: carbon-nitrogen hydrolase family protein [Rhodospirillales bacterium]
MIPFAIAGVQMHVSATESNLEAMSAQIDIAMARFPWVQMVMFSELAPFGPLMHNIQTLPGPAEAAFCEMAARHGIWLVPGSMFERDGESVYNTASVIDPTGTVVGRHRKLFPFSPYEQDVDSGKDFLVFDVPEVGRFGVSICYDMWFPETTRTLISMGAEVILHPTLTNTIDRDVERAICRASAAMNQCYMIDINGIGAGGVGRSFIADPSGHILYESGGGPEIIPVEVDLARVRRERETGVRGLGQPLKSFRDRKVEFPVYDRAQPQHPYLGTLGPLAMPGRGSKAGVGAMEPKESEQPAAAGVAEVVDFPIHPQGETGT